MEIEMQRSDFVRIITYFSDQQATVGPFSHFSNYLQWKKINKINYAVYVDIDF